ncbi:AAL132Cp [Eremothecium gossypii ATCC 10895]|uniref:DNA-directed DNA polymerase n=1 Tax=Eremothecium gossypii (strain ATCC 10895 / CBS 109.51 / FGSC 9923 / NRRL Y-1056) TaxID=284811 RepID=Q75F60_EREGS|nr:AAL132Cp [Eremothecium gossypii ATCC 10895]AAS50234.1 AAL132Cp [Eremothecium gossypii ATCC 10895]
MQFYQMYAYRLNESRKRVLANCQRKWDDGFRIQGKPVVQKAKVLDIQAGEPCWCVGTIYCEMKYKPNVLEEVVNDTYGTKAPVKSYTDPEGTDEIMLEDESGRVLLVGDIITSTPFVTGTVVGVLGMEAEAGTFQVVDICYPQAIPQAPLVRAPGKSVALISGICAASNDPKLSLKLRLLQDLLSGDIGDTGSIASVARLIICGDSVGTCESNSIGGALDELGSFMANTLTSLPITILPGANDPSERSLPQQPLHKALFKQALKPYFAEVNSEVFESVTNPYWFDLEGIQVLVSSGQNVDDMCKYVIPYLGTEQLRDTIEHRLDLIEASLKWQNIAPTAPDTLWCYPYKDNDPFIMNEWPHVYIIGNQHAYGYRKVLLENEVEVVLITLPKFSSSGQFVILDLDTLNAEVITIDA